MIVAGTGSRSLALESTKFQLAVLDSVMYYLNEYSPDLVISGGAEGFDSLLAHAAYRLNIPYDVYLPFSAYGDYYWRNHSVTGKDRWTTFQQMTDRARNVRLVTKNLRGGSSNFMRNDAMVEALDYRTDMLFAFDKGSKGTRYTINKARQANVEVFYIDTEVSDYDL